MGRIAESRHATCCAWSPIASRTSFYQDSPVLYSPERGHVSKSCADGVSSIISHKPWVRFFNRALLHFVGVLFIWCFVTPSQIRAAYFSYPLSNWYLTSSQCGFNGTCVGTGTCGFHAGIDLGGNLSIYPSAPGRVVLIQKYNLPSPGFSECKETIKGSCQDHGLGNTVILEHLLANGTSVYSQYSHLSSFANITVGQYLTANQSVGIMGGTGYERRDRWLTHLHFEIKTHNVIGNPPGSGACWGYTPGPAQNYGYLNPTDVINKPAYQTIENCTVSVGLGTGGAELLAFQTAYNLAGGQSILGCPTSTVSVGFTSFAGTLGHHQTQANGDIEYLTNSAYGGQAFAIINPLFSKWASFGFNANNPLGYPIGLLSSESTSYIGTRLKYQRFEGGALEWHLSGARSGTVYEVHGAIYTKWGQKGYAGPPLGLPIGDERNAQPSGATGKTGRVSDFEGGHIHWWTAALEAFETHGAIDSLYASMGGSASWLGFPISDEFVDATGYARSNFEGGHITTTDGVNYRAFSYSDTLPPTVTISSPISSPTYSTASSPIALGGTASDNVGVASVSWSNDRGGTGTCSGTTSWSCAGITLQSGQNVLTVTARDDAGNPGNDILTVSYTIPDKEPPSITITSPTSNPAHSATASPITLSGTASDKVGVIQVTWTNDRGGSGSCSGTASWTCSSIPLQSGQNVLTVTARDAANNAGIDTLTVTSSAPCYTLAKSASPAGGGTVTINTSANCSGGYTSGTVILVTATPASDYRFSGWAGNGGSFSNAGSANTSFTITGNASITAYFQSPGVCVYSISPEQQSHGSGAGTGSVSVTTTADCAWSTTSNDPWITITSGSRGSGSGNLNYSIAANTANYARTGSLTIAGRTFTVIQLGSTSSSTTLWVPPGGASSALTLGPANQLKAGYASVAVNSGNAPYGTAIFGYTQNGVVVSEVGVPASPPTHRARFFVDCRTNLPGSGGGSRGTVSVATGFAAVNQGTGPATITLRLFGESGITLAYGTVRLMRDEHIAKYLHQLEPDLILPPGFIDNGLGSLEIVSDQPVSILALRLTMNERGEQLMSTTPIADLTQPLPSGLLLFPQIADGGGYQTSLILMNTSSAIESGLVRFIGNVGNPLSVGLANSLATGSQFRYFIMPGGFARIVTDGAPSSVTTGWAQLTPDAGTATPVGAVVYGFTQGGVLVTEAGVPATVATTHARIYVDKSGGHDTGLAIANPSNLPIYVTARAFQTDGATPAGAGSSLIDLNALGHGAKFAGQIIPGLPDGFTGVLDLRSENPFAALTLRSLTNARGNFLVTTFPVADVNQPAPTPIIFPQIADGGGYQTQVILLNVSGAASAVTLRYMDNEGRPLEFGQSADGTAAVAYRRVLMPQNADVTFLSGGGTKRHAATISQSHKFFAFLRMEYVQNGATFKPEQDQGERSP